MFDLPEQQVNCFDELLVDFVHQLVIRTLNFKTKAGEELSIARIVTRDSFRKTAGTGEIRDGIGKFDQRGIDRRKPRAVRQVMPSNRVAQSRRQLPIVEHEPGEVSMVEAKARFLNSIQLRIRPHKQAAVGDGGGGPGGFFQSKDATQFLDSLRLIK